MRPGAKSNSRRNYLGSQLPTDAATVFKLKGIKLRGLSYCIALANAFLTGIDTFGTLMLDEKCQITAPLYLKFQPIWLKKYDRNQVS